jgi:hypothetical protein
LGRGYANGRFFNGRMRDVRIWRVARTPAQIAAGMNQVMPPQADLVASYRCNQGVPNGNNAGITSLSDAAGNGNTGTLNNFALTGTASNWVSGPGPAEVCNGLDDDCDGLVDEGFATQSYWPDADNDGSGSASAAPVNACSPPPGHVTNNADQCDADPLKTAPGACGCGTPDTDSDADGTANCSDGCPNDPLKTNPGVCGCGTADTDSDNDGTANCNDGCPNDPFKTAPGICGCGTADTDSDGDGTANCNDGCPNDALKTTPGICGCGTADTDSDNDGTANCNDGCPADPLKTAPGTCGCGTVDADTDGDGLADCVDSCPSVAGAAGDPCDDGLACTVNDVITTGCTCAGDENNLSGQLSADYFFTQSQGTYVPLTAARTIVAQQNAETGA